MADQLIFEESVEMLARIVRGAGLPPKCVQRLQAAGLDVSTRIKPGYPASIWATCVTIIGEEMYPEQAPLDAQASVGRRVVELFVEGTLGSAMFSLLRILGPDRTIARMTRNLRSGSNFLETGSRQVGPHEYELWLSDVSGLPGFYRGFLACGLENVGAKNLSVTIANTEGAQCTYRAAWS